MFPKYIFFKLYLYMEVDNSSFTKLIKNYLILDDEINKRQENLKLLKNKKDEVENMLIDEIHKRNLENSILDLGKSKLFLHEKKTYSSPSFKFIENCLKDVIPNEEHLLLIINKLKSERQVKTVTELKRKLQ